jgi:hypothetical protein
MIPRKIRIPQKPKRRAVPVAAIGGFSGGPAGFLGLPVKMPESAGTPPGRAKKPNSPVSAPFRCYKAPPDPGSQKKCIILTQMTVGQGKIGEYCPAGTSGGACQPDLGRASKNRGRNRFFLWIFFRRPPEYRKKQIFFEKKRKKNKKSPIFLTLSFCRDIIIL